MNRCVLAFADVQFVKKNICIDRRNICIRKNVITLFVRMHSYECVKIHSYEFILTGVRVS